MKLTSTRLDLYLIPLLVLGFYALQLDRSNISYALTDALTTELGITTDDANLGNQLMIIGIIVAEIPSNLMLQKVGASIWLTGQVGAFGLVSLFQAFCTTKQQFFATRFLLGLTEGGYIPGAQYMLAMFYDRRELALRTAFFYFGNYFAVATGSLIAAGILGRGHTDGLAGWQRLFTIEGSLTLGVFLVFILVLPRSLDHTKLIHGLWDFFSADETAAMSLHVVSNDRTKAEAKAHITFASVLDALSDYRLWMHLVLNIAALTPKGGLALCAPTVIKSLGFTKTNANLLRAVPQFGVVFMAFAMSRTYFRHNAASWAVVYSGSHLIPGIRSCALRLTGRFQQMEKIRHLRPPELWEFPGSGVERCVDEHQRGQCAEEEHWIGIGGDWK